MGYFVGPNLERKIQEYDLADLDVLLLSIANGTGVWPGDLAAHAKPEQLETLRIIFYSMLHKYGLKSEFIVKMTPSISTVAMHFKAAPATQRRTGGVVRIASADEEQPASIKPGDVQTEDMTNLFSESDPLLLSQNESAQSNEKGE
jgi:hypothetical protein